MMGDTSRNGLRKLCLLEMGANANMRCTFELSSGCRIMAMKKRPVPSECPAYTNLSQPVTART